VVCNLTGMSAELFVRGEIQATPPDALLVVNARVHTDPAALRDIVKRCLEQVTGNAVRPTVVTMEAFSPARPQPTHRYSAVL
jgi:hypothetical protein